MIELKNEAQIESAIKRAKAERKHLFVKRTEIQREYRVTNRRNGQVYWVKFNINWLGKRYGHCTCKAGEFGIPCKHLAACAGLNLCLAKQGVFKQENGRTN
jgi:hypothetical protein